MKRLNKLFALLLFLTLGSSVGYSQATISTTLLVLKDTAYVEDTATATVTIKNIDNAPYTGYLNVYYTTDTIAFTPQALCSLATVTLNPGDSIVTSCTIQFDSTHFHPLSNIIVVWSSGNGKFAADSLWDSVYLYPQTAGVHENGLSSAFLISPNPAKDFIQIKMHRSSLSAETPEQIKITDVFGRSVGMEAFGTEAEQKISVHHLPPGLYFLELLYKDNKKAVRKFVRSD